jgi:chromosome segregation ATPase
MTGRGIMMARANFVAKARKDNRVALKGESYYWWKFRYGPKHYSKTRPHRSQLTQSAFYSQLWQLEDDFEGALSAVKDLQQVDELIESMIGDLEALMDECQESLDAMPESLQESSMSGELLAERIEGIEGWISELQSIDLAMEEPESDDMIPDDDEVEAHLENIKEEILNANPGLA